MNKVYRVDVFKIDAKGTHLVTASSLVKARNHVMRIVSARAATPIEIVQLALREKDAIEIEEAGDE